MPDKLAEMQNALIPIDSDHSLAEKKATLEELEKLARQEIKSYISIFK